MMGKRKKNDKDENDEVEIIFVSKRKGKRKVGDLPDRITPTSIVAGPSRDVQVERIISIKSSKTSSEDERELREELEDTDKARWEERDAALARALQQEFNAPYQPLGYQESALQLQQIGVTDPELLAQLTGSGIYTNENFADVLHNLITG
jgi:hypothetical protein